MANIIYKCSGCGAEYDDEYRCFECIASCNTPVVDISRAELARAINLRLIHKHYNPKCAEWRIV